MHTPQQIVCYQLDPSKLSVSMNNKEIGNCSCITCSKVSYLKVFPLAYSKLYKCSMRMLVHLPLLHHPLLVCFSGNFSMPLYQRIQALGRKTYDKKNKHLSVQSSQSACTPRPSGLGNSQPPPPTHRWPARRHRARSCWGSRSTFKHNII